MKTLSTDLGGLEIVRRNSRLDGFAACGSCVDRGATCAKRGGGVTSRSPRHTIPQRDNVDCEPGMRDLCSDDFVRPVLREKNVDLEEEV